ncbi:indolepyruvate ferredoxin oxidoreductase subunit alpha [Candidatus Woesearchaeota archaeon]|nr:indolepyruvate ferredoxin oxidoreductase subunit alpha [Candidatus Woesearchaeota archaeon]
MKTEVLENAGKKVVLLGNEAIARGAIEAGIGMAASYPGTPSSEVPIVLSSVAKKCGFYFEYSSNEKVAFETAAGAAWSGVRAITSMKHFGLNVASDSVMPVAYTGVLGGYVLIVADDPEGWSSAQSEQDTRHFSRMARMPTIEPSNAQECLDFTKMAFDISEEFQIPVILRTTTKVSHSIGTVKLGKIKKPKTKGRFKKDFERYYNIKPNLQMLHKKIDKKLEDIGKKYSNKFNKIIQGQGDIGIVTNGVCFEYAKEALQELKIKPPIAKIGMTNPISSTFISNFIKNKKTILVLEELEPIIEDYIRLIAKEANPRLKIHGKDLLSRAGEYNLERIMPALEKVFKKKCDINFKTHQTKTLSAQKNLPPRKPVFCQGCPHRSTFYAVKKVYGKDAVFAGDIGCYILGIFEPYDMGNFCISMGASIGIGHGITKVSDQEVICFVGDSTFFHAGMPPIANLKFNDGKSPLIVVLNNDITAMTGHQPNPGSGVTGMGEKVAPVVIEDVAKALGADVKSAVAFNHKQLVENLQQFKDKKGPRVLVSNGACRLLTKRQNQKKGIKFIKFKIDQNKCKKCGTCTNLFACPAISELREKKGDVPTYYIDPDMCWGCSVCSQICPYGAIHPIAPKTVSKKNGK